MADLTVTKIRAEGFVPCENIISEKCANLNASNACLDDEVIVIDDDQKATATSVICSVGICDEIVELDSRPTPESLHHFVSTDMTLTMPVWDEAVDSSRPTSINSCVDGEVPYRGNEEEEHGTAETSYLTVESARTSIASQPDTDQNDMLGCSVDILVDDTVRYILDHMIDQLDDCSAGHTQGLSEGETLERSECIEVIPRDEDDGDVMMLKAGAESDDDVEILLDGNTLKGNDVATNNSDESTENREVSLNGGTSSNCIVNLDPEGPLEENRKCDIGHECEATVNELVSTTNDMPKLKDGEDLTNLGVVGNKQVDDDLGAVKAVKAVADNVKDGRSDGEEILNVGSEDESVDNVAVCILVEKIASRDRKIVELEAEIRKLEDEGDWRIEDDDSEPCSPVLNFKKALKVFDLKAAVRELEESLKTTSVERDDLSETLRRVETELSDLKRKFDESDAIRLQAELKDARDAAKAAVYDIRDKDERIALLEIDIEYARDQVKLRENELKTCREKLEEEIVLIKAELHREKDINKNLSHDLKEEMKQRIRELKAVTESEKEGVVKQVESLQEKEVDYLRKLDNLRTNNEDLIRKTRDLRADVKTKNMEAEAYRGVAEKLRLVVVKLEKDNARFERRIKDLQLNAPGSEINSGPEVITIDTDDQESNEDEDDDTCLENIRQFHLSLLNDFDGSPSNKRAQSPEDDSCVAKKRRTASESSLVTLVADTAVLVSEKGNAMESGGNTSSADIRLLVEVENQSTNSLEVTIEEGPLVEYLTLKHKEVGSEKEVQTDDVCLVEDAPSQGLPDISDQQCLLSRLQFEVVKVVNARDRLEPVLISLSKELRLETAKVVFLENRLRQRAAIEENVLQEQQSQLKKLQQRLSDVETELQERNAAVHSLEAEKDATMELNSQLQCEVSTLSKAVEMSRLESEALKEVTTKLDSIDDAMQVLLKERDLLQERVDVLESGQEGLQDLRDKNSLFHAELSVALSEQERLNGLLSKLEDEPVKVLALEQSVADLKANANAAVAERNELVAKLAQRQCEVEKIMDACKQTIVMADTERCNLLQQCRESAEASERTAEGLRTEVSEAARVNVDLLEQLKGFRCKLEEAEAHLSEKTATIKVLRSEVDEYRRDRDLAKVRIESLCEDIVLTKKTLAETEKKIAIALNTASSLEKNVVMSVERKQMLEDLKSKFTAIKGDLSNSLSDREAEREKLAEMRDECTVDVSFEVTETGAKNEMAAFEQQKRRVKEIEVDILNNVSNFADLEKCKVEADDCRKRFLAEFRQLKEDSNAANITRENLEAELETLRQENGALSTKIRSLEVLVTRVEGLGSAENGLNRGISQLEDDLLEDDALENKVVKFIKVDLDDAQGRLSRLAAATEDLRSATFGKTTQKSSTSDEMPSNSDLQSILSEKVSTLTVTVVTLKSNNEALRIRLNLALANGRRMEKLLQTMQTSFASEATQPEIGLQLETIRRERDDLVKKLADADNLGKRLKVKVINLAKAIKKMQGHSHDPQETFAINIDDWERFANECQNYSTSRQGSLTSTGKSPPKAVGEVSERSGSVQLPTRLTQMVNNNKRTASDSNPTKENECGDRKRPSVKEPLQPLVSKETLVKSADIQGETLMVKRADSKRLSSSVTKKALNTITNETPHSSLVVQVQPSKCVQPSLPPDGSHPSDECNVQ